MPYYTKIVKICLVGCTFLMKKGPNKQKSTKFVYHGVQKLTEFV